MDTGGPGLAGRINAEFELSRDRLRSLRRQPAEGIRARQARLSLYENACERLGPLWGPRLDHLKQRLGERLQISVALHSGRRQADIVFTSSLARIRISFTAMTDADVTSLILESALSILPSLLSYPARERLSLPLERIDERAVGDWLDDRIVEFVRIYLSLYENDCRLGVPLVEDPVTRVRFPAFAAAATLERHGKIFYFMSNETREEYEALTAAPLQAP